MNWLKASPLAALYLRLSSYQALANQIKCPAFSRATVKWLKNDVELLRKNRLK